MEPRVRAVRGADQRYNRRDAVAQLTDEYMDDKLPPEIDTEFPNAPKNWSRDEARQVAKEQGLQLEDVHWRVVRLLQDYYRENPAEHIDLTDVHDMLDRAFQDQGGMKYLHTKFPEGPVHQGCRLAGIEPPTGAVDHGFGSGA